MAGVAGAAGVEKSNARRAGGRWGWWGRNGLGQKKRNQIE